MYWPRGTILSRIVIFQVNISYIANVPGVKFTLVLKRRPLYYLFNIIIPAVLLAALSAVTFVVPVDSGEKISFGIAILLAFSMFMLILQDNTPQTDTPILCTYIPFWDNNVDIWLLWWAASLNPIGIYAYNVASKSRYILCKEWHLSGECFGYMINHSLLVKGWQIVRLAQFIRIWQFFS